ncbi:MAG: tetratricopeptide repeat protein [Candidatus Sericytochromatia bacterium]
MHFQPFLRQTSQDVEAWAARLEQALSHLPRASGGERLRLLGECGSAYRALGQLDAAATYFERALDLARVQVNPRLEAANLVRLGVVCHYQNRWDEAETCFAAALALSEQEPDAWDYRDFALQHWGKLCVEQGRFAQAQAYFEAARLLRQVKGDTELLASTDEALLAFAGRVQADSHHPEPVA